MLRCSLQLTKHTEQIPHLILSDAFAAVDDVDQELLLDLIESNEDANGASLSELESIFYQIDKDLFQANGVSVKYLGQGRLLEQDLVVLD